MKPNFLALSGLALVAVWATPANALPGAGVRGIDAGSNVIQIDRRDCHWRHGHRVCRHVEPLFEIDLGGHRRHRHHDHYDHGDHHDHDKDHGDHHDHSKKY